MKYRIIVLFVIAIALTSCMTNEQKADRLIRDDLSKILLDFSSYEPVETVVIEAYDVVSNNAMCLELASDVHDSFEEIKEYSEDAEKEREYMDIWGPPTQYTSSYSDRQYYKHRKEASDLYEKVKEETDILHTIVNELQDSIATSSPEELIGWDVTHRFRCRNGGGNMTLATYRYIIDKNFKNILYRNNEENDAKARSMLILVENHTFDKLWEDD